MQPHNEGIGLMLAHDDQCQAQYSVRGGKVRVRVGAANVELSPAEFLSVCATLLKAARALGQQPRIAGLVPEWSLQRSKFPN